MKIVLFGPAYPFRGGVPHFTGALQKALTDAGHEVTIVNFLQLFPKRLFPGKSQLDDSPHAKVVDSERVFVPWKPWTWTKTAHAIAAHHPDLILAMWWMPLFGPAYRGVARALPEKFRKRLVYVLHDVVSHERFPGDAILARLALKTAGSFLALSESEAKVLQRILPSVKPDHIHIVAHPVFDSYEPYPGSAEDARRSLGVTADKVLLFFGFIRHYKGLDLLLQAMPAVLSEHPDLQLLVCGPCHENREQYERILDSLGLRKTVIIHDRYFSGREVSTCFAAADVVVLPYRSATQSGVVPLSYALRVPVIATNVGALSEVVRDGKTGFLVEPESPAALADAILRFYAAGGRAAFRSAVEIEAARYGWAPFIFKIESIQSHRE